jgi:HlyD family secretion protein
VPPSWCRAGWRREELDTAQAASDRALAELARSGAQVVQAQAALDAEAVLLSKATIHAPIQGIVLSRNVEPGQTVAASFQTPVLFTLAENLAQMELHVNVDEADVGQVREGQAATFAVDAYPDRQFPARITEVHFASLTVTGVVTYETVLSVDNSELLLRPGMTATADIVVERVDDATLVPNAALRFSPVAETEVPQAGQQSLLGRLFPRPQRGSAPNNRESREDPGRPQVWVLRDDQPVAIPLTIGATDGISSAVVDGGIEPGTAVLVDTIDAGS